MLANTILLILSILSIIAFCIKKYFLEMSRLEYYLSKLDGPPVFPLIGSAYYFLGNNKQVVNNVLQLIKRYKAPFKILLAREAYVVITEPEDIELVLNQALGKVKKYNFTKAFLEEGLFTAPVDKWKRHKKVISTTFKMPILNGFVQVFSEHSKNIVEKFKNLIGKGCFDAYPVMRVYGLGIICETAMGQKVGEKNEDFDYPGKLSRAMELLFMRLFQYWLHPNFIWRLTSYCRELNQLSTELRQFVSKLVAEKKEQFLSQQNDYCEESLKGKCFIDHLVELSETNKHWSDFEIFEKALTMVAAGSDSLGSSVSYILMVIAMHPSVQDKIFEEIVSIFGDNDREVTYEDLPKMVYLERVIKETLRLFPVAVTVGRRVDEDIVTSRYTLPAGCECIVGIMYTHGNPKLWPDPNKFDPDRFLPEEISKRHPYSYLPLSGGPRNCIGSKYATMAMKTVVTTIARNYKLSTDFQDLSDIDFVPGIVLKSAKARYSLCMMRFVGAVRRRIS